MVPDNWFNEYFELSIFGAYLLSSAMAWVFGKTNDMDGSQTATFGAICHVAGVLGAIFALLFAFWRKGFGY